MMDEQGQSRTGILKLRQTIDLEHLTDRRSQMTDWLMNVTREMHKALVERTGDGRNYRVVANMRLLVLIDPSQAKVGEYVDGERLGDGIPEGCHFVEVENWPGVWERARSLYPRGTEGFIKMITRFSIMGDREAFSIPHIDIVSAVVGFIGLSLVKCKIPGVLCIEELERIGPNYKVFAVSAPYGGIMEIRVVGSEVFCSWPPPARQIKIPKHVRASQDALREKRDLLTNGLFESLRAMESNWIRGAGILSKRGPGSLCIADLRIRFAGCSFWYSSENGDLRFEGLLPKDAVLPPGAVVTQGGPFSIGVMQE